MNFKLAKKILIPLLCSTFLTTCVGESVPSEVDNRKARIMVIPYPPYRSPEPYTYPGPSPPMHPPPRTPEFFNPPNPTFPSHPPPRLPDLFMFQGISQPPKFSDQLPIYVPPLPQRPKPVMDFQQLPKWCKAMWEREECGTKCMTLRKICRNMNRQLKENIEDYKTDNESSPSTAYPYLKQLPHNYFKKPQPPVVYSKTGVHNTYFAQPAWPVSNPYYKFPPYFFYKPTNHLNNEMGLNPQFTYIDGEEKQLNKTHTTEPTSLEEEMEGTTVKPETSTVAKTRDNAPIENSTIKKVKPVLVKGAYPVKVFYNYPSDDEVTTLSPLMFEYDQHSNRRYYGDRIFMSSVLPVAERKLESKEDRTITDFDDILSY